MLRIGLPSIGTLRAPMHSAGRFSPLGPLGTASNPWMIGEWVARPATPLPDNAAFPYQTTACRVNTLLIAAPAKKLVGNLSLRQAGPLEHKRLNVICKRHSP